MGAAVVGGTASVIGGGKFANGAMTGAFSRLFNDLKCYQANTCAGKVMNTKASCGNDCVLHDAGIGGKIWVKPAMLPSLASVKSGNLNSIDDLTTTPAEFSKQLAVAATVTGVGAFGGAITGVTWVGSLGTTSLVAGGLSVLANPNPSAYDYFTLGVGARAQVIDYLAPGASLVNQGTGLILDGIGWSLPDKSNGGQ